jgi:serine phosphatase RsbU (regulator of sigma subunit)
MQCLEVWGGSEAVETGLSVPGIDAWVSSTPYHGDVDGGDVYYLSMCEAGRISRFALADVSGHGTTAGELGQLLRKLMRKHIRTLDQTIFARTLNNRFAHLAREGRFATAILATYFAPTDHLIVCNLGHPRPLWYRSATATWELLDHVASEPTAAIRNLPLGIIEGVQYMQFSIKLGQHDRVLLFTDSLIDARNPEGRILGEEGLLSLVRGLPTGSPSEMGRSIPKSVTAYRGASTSDDDETLLVLHHNGTNPPLQSLAKNCASWLACWGLIFGTEWSGARRSCDATVLAT